MNKLIIILMVVLIAVFTKLGRVSAQSNQHELSSFGIKVNGKEIGQDGVIDGLKVHSFTKYRKVDRKNYFSESDRPVFAESLVVIIGDGGGSPPEYDDLEYEQGYDGSIGVFYETTIYYTIEPSSVFDEVIDLIRVEGEWIILDYQLSLENREVRILQNGYYWDLYPNHYVEQEVIINPQSGSFNYYVPTSWYPVDLQNSHAMGAIMTCDVVRGLGSWEFELRNVVYFAWEL